MAAFSIFAMLAIGAAIGYAVSIAQNARRFVTSVNTISGALGATIAGQIIPNTLWIEPAWIEHLARGVAGAFAMIFAIALIRKV